MRIEHLIYAIRESTDHDGENSGITDNEIVGYINDAQKTIQALVFKSNTKADLFRASAVFENNQEGEYDLPEDIYAVNAIYSVMVFTGNNPNDKSGWSRITRVEADAPGIGYWTEDGKLKVHGYPNQKVKILYFKKLPLVSKRVGKVNSKTASTIMLAPGYDTSIGKADDFISIVSSTGDKKSELEVRMVYVTGSMDVIGDTTPIVVGDFALLGKNTVNEIGLNEECFPYLKDYVRQRIYGRQNYNDAGKQDYFTSAQKSEIISLFSNNQKDELIPPQYNIDLDLELD